MYKLQCVSTCTSENVQLVSELSCLPTKPCNSVYTAYSNCSTWTNKSRKKKKKQGCHDNETDKKTQICAKPSKTLPIHLTKVWHQGILGAASVQFVTSFATLKLPVHSCIKLKDWILRTWWQQISCIPTIKISRYIVMSRKELLCGIKHC